MQSLYLAGTMIKCPLPFTYLRTGGGGGGVFPTGVASTGSIPLGGVC